MYKNAILLKKKKSFCNHTETTNPTNLLINKMTVKQKSLTKM